MSDDPNELIDQREVAKALRCSVSTLNRMVKAGRFPEPIRFVAHGFPRWPRAALRDWLEAERARMAAEMAARPVALPKSRGRPPGAGWRRQA